MGDDLRIEGPRQCHNIYMDSPYAHLRYTHCEPKVVEQCQGQPFDEYTKCARFVVKRMEEDLQYQRFQYRYGIPPGEVSYGWLMNALGEGNNFGGQLQLRFMAPFDDAFDDTRTSKIGFKIMFAHGIESPDRSPHEALGFGLSYEHVVMRNRFTTATLTAEVSVYAENDLHLVLEPGLRFYSNNFLDDVGLRPVLGVSLGYDTLMNKPVGMILLGIAFDQP